MELRNLKALDVSIDELESRINALQFSIGNQDPNNRRDILQDVKNIDSNLLKLQNNIPKWTEFYNQYTQLKSLLGTSSLHRISSSSISAKRDLILHAEDEILQVTQQLEDSYMAEKQLNSTQLREVSQYKNQLGHLEALHLQEIAQVAQVHQTIQEFLKTYNHIISF